MAPKQALRYLTMLMVGFSDCESAALTAIEGALWKRLIAERGGRSDHCGYDKEAPFHIAGDGLSPIHARTRIPPRRNTVQ
ncbi:hypothetical protein [Cupriavidus necator]|uniref:hypothetical protein n=1 Tax=Cupriavidus necator TaxID=106590 RepID=UPI0005B5085A|nr:hypothetical protein [Cupriavidus necator]